MSADSVANTLFTSLGAGADFTLPVVNLNDSAFSLPAGTGPLYDPVSKLGNDDLTSGQVGGAGTFDRVMSSLRAHLLAEHQSGRISSAEYVKAYIAMTEAALQGAVQYLLGKDQAYWQALQVQATAQRAQVELVTARVQLQTAKAQLAEMTIQAATAKAQYALTKLQLATTNAQYDTAQYQLTDMLPEQKTLVQRQQDLYAEQVTSYKRDAENKAAKIFTDAWITMRSMDEGYPLPANFDNTHIDTVLNTLRTNLGLI